MNNIKTIIIAALIAASSALTFAAPAKAFTCYQNSPFAGGSTVCN